MMALTRIRTRFSSLPFCVLALCLAIGLPALLSSPAMAQAVPPATWPGGNGNPAEQPLPGQVLGSDLTLNQGATAIAAENESFNKFAVGLQASGGAITNFFGSSTNPQTAGFAQFTGNFGVLLQNERTRYFAFYQPQYNLYPQFTQVNSFAQSAFQTLTHQITERTGIEWDLTGARYLSLNQFLPQTLEIGGIGIIVPTIGQQLLEDSYEITNAATTVHLRSLLSARWTLDATVTGGFFLLVPTDEATATPNATQRFVTSGGDIQLNYQLSDRDIVGGELTPIYTYGLLPSGHETAETLEGVYQRQLTPTLSARVAAGPLFIQSSSSIYGSLQDTSYAVNAALSRSLRQSQFSLTYSRAFIVSLLSPATAANSVGFTAYVPMGRNWIAIGDATWVHDSGTATYGAGTIYGGEGELAYQLASKVQIFGRYSVLSQSFDQLTGQQSYSFVRNQFGGGIRFSLGNPTTPNTFGGVH
ncbi:MAG: hypothetical protein WA708_04150 [Acidobacteriaceae bacterium]